MHVILPKTICMCSSRPLSLQTSLKNAGTVHLTVGGLPHVLEDGLRSTLADFFIK
jgi:hypothetical protein